VAAFLSILSSLLVGVALVVAPWSPLWEANWLLTLWPSVRGFVLSGFARGAVTGLGLVNLALALRDVYARVGGRESGPFGGPDAG
jgi:hypothetical protein